MSLRALGVVGLGQQRLDRHVDEIGIAVKGLAVGEGELGGLDLQVDEIRSGRIEAVEVEALQHRELLQGDGTLRPGPGLEHAVAPVIVGRPAPRRSLATSAMSCAGQHAPVRAVR